MSNLSDIFIYYVASLPREEEARELMAYLWLSLLQVLLHYAERGNQRDMHAVVVAVHDNIKRVIEFMVLQGAMIEDDKLWGTTWEIVGAFFTEMKASVCAK